MLFSIGHSNHDIKRFLELLRQNSIDIVADVRSSPFSKYSPQFNQPTLRSALKHANVEYVFLGEELGGRPRGDEFYDHEGRVLYDRLAESQAFRKGLGEVKSLGDGNRVVLMCSEENPAICHRFLLISRVLEKAGTGVAHIRGGGEIQTTLEVARATTHSDQEDGQLVLFDSKPEPPWKSLQSVSPKRPRQSSSEFSGVQAFKD